MQKNNGVKILILLCSGLLLAFTSSKKNTEKTISVGETVWVSRTDGSKQCEKESGQSLEEGSQDLMAQGVSVLDSKKASDQKIRIQMCGASSGQKNSYQIPKSDLPKAISAGFKESSS